jgi:hypothetical protein
MSVNKVLDSERLYQSVLSSALIAGPGPGCEGKCVYAHPLLGVVWDSVRHRLIPTKKPHGNKFRIRSVRYII